MKALVKAQATPGIWLRDIPEPKVGPNDVLIEIAKTAICGTDMHIYNWDAWAQKTIPVPMDVCHEYCGRIVEVVSEVKGLKRVLLDCSPISSDPAIEPSCLRHIFFEREGAQFGSQLTSMPMQTEGGDVFVWAAAPRRLSIEDMVELGVSPYQVVEFVKKLSEAVSVSEMINMPTASA